MINIKRIKRLKVYVAVFIIISIGFMIASITGVGLKFIYLVILIYKLGINKFKNIN